MARGLFAYVSPDTDVSDEERQALLEHLRVVYSRAVQVAHRLAPGGAASSGVRAGRRTPASIPEPEAPPMQVIFGVDQLRALVESLLEPDQRLGKVTLTAPGSATAQRDRIHAIAQRMAREAGCLTETIERGDEYSITIYGPRSRVGVIARALRQGA
jgi:hypothetical protein